MKIVNIFKLFFEICVTQINMFSFSEGRVYSPDVSRHIAENHLEENWTLS